MARVVPSPARLALFSYKICPFCAKVKAVARHAGIALHTIEVNPLTKSQISWSKDHRKVPIAVMDDGRVVVESDLIVEELLKLSAPDDVFASAEAQKWSKWATNDLALMMYPNITRNFAECREALAYADTSFGMVDATLIRTVGALGMSFAHGKIKKKYGIVDERASMWERLDVWEKQVGSASFRGGKAPDLGDVAVFGVLDALKGLSAHSEITEKSIKLKSWLADMDAALPPPNLIK